MANQREFGWFFSDNWCIFYETRIACKKNDRPATGSERKPHPFRTCVRGGRILPACFRCRQKIRLGEEGTADDSENMSSVRFASMSISGRGGCIFHWNTIGLRDGALAVYNNDNVVTGLFLREVGCFWFRVNGGGGLPLAKRKKTNEIQKKVYWFIALDGQ